MSLTSRPVALTVEQLYSSVSDAAPRVAVFDCDGTLWSGDAGSSFMWWSMESGLLSADRVAWLKQHYDGYRRGDVSEEAICGEMVQVYAGLDEAKLRAAAAEFFAREIESHIFPELHQLVADLQGRGVEIWAVSSTNDWVIEEGMKRFGIAPECVLAARVAIADGHITDQVLDVPTDAGKVRALAAVGVTEPDVVFGNSIHDAAMLSIARHPFPINPTPGLLTYSAERNWAVFHPKEATLPPSEKHEGAALA